MAAPTKAAANVKKALANSEPSTHGTSRHFAEPRWLVGFRGIADIEQTVSATDLWVHGLANPVSVDYLLNLEGT
jgi:hypothetical protein